MPHHRESVELVPKERNSDAKPLSMTRYSLLVPYSNNNLLSLYLQFLGDLDGYIFPFGGLPRRRFHLWRLRHRIRRSRSDQGKGKLFWRDTPGTIRLFIPVRLHHRNQKHSKKLRIVFFSAWNGKKILKYTSDRIKKCYILRLAQKSFPFLCYLLCTFYTSNLSSAVFWEDFGWLRAKKIPGTTWTHYILLWWIWVWVWVNMDVYVCMCVGVSMCVWISASRLVQICMIPADFKEQPKNPVWSFILLILYIFTTLFVEISARTSFRAEP